MLFDQTPGRAPAPAAGRRFNGYDWLSKVHEIQARPSDFTGSLGYWRRSQPHPALHPGLSEIGPGSGEGTGPVPGRSATVNTVVDSEACKLVGGWVGWLVGSLVGGFARNG
eukprot:758045-Hanusia_phi.AAC.8